MAGGVTSSKQRQSHVETIGLAERIYCSKRSELSSYLSSHLGGSGKEIVSASVIPKDYGNAYDFSGDYLCAELMSKYPSWDLGIDRAGVALQKFSSSELQCSLANRRLIDLGANSLLTVSTMRILEDARRKIQDLLGPFSWLEAAEHFRHGPGATTSKGRKHRDLYYKIRDFSPNCSYTLVPILNLLRCIDPLWDFEPRVVGGSKVVTVPKSAKTDRTICIEPDLNVMVQLGIGRCIRTRLRRVGLLFPNSQEINNLAAREGSITGQLATVDLSSASDTISKELVRALMPHDWLQALEQARTPVALLGGVGIPLEKFSAMGNGYTFELETLIFWSIAKAIVAACPEWNQRVLVYGDDIIVDVRAVGLLQEVFTEVGFTMNPDKTFVDGPFRESCGKHYFHGVDVTPFYLRKELRSPLEWMWAANTVRRYARYSVWGLDSDYRLAYEYARSKVPQSHRVVIPDGYGDGGLIGDFDEACPQRAPHGLEGWRYRAISARALSNEVRGLPRIAKSLYQIGAGAEELGKEVLSPYPRISPTDGALRMVRAESFDSAVPFKTRYHWKDNICSRWPSYGPWL
jgi:hypothetical protein